MTGNDGVAKVEPSIVPFRRLMALRSIGEDIYESILPSWAPGFSFRTTAFGGHVYAQSICAASRTVKHGMVIHNVTGHFLLPGTTTLPYTYHIRCPHDGTRYCLRTVEVYQHKPEEKSAHPCYMATMSFKRDERNDPRWEIHGHQDVPSDYITKTYADVLADIKSEDQPTAPNADADWWYTGITSGLDKNVSVSPGLDMRKVNMDKYHKRVTKGVTDRQEKVSKWRQLIFYRFVLDDEKGDGKAIQGLPQKGEMLDPRDLNLSAAAHCYASDRNSLFLIPRAHGFPNRLAAIASLGHTVIFNGPLDRMRMIDESGSAIWFVQEAWTPHSGANRGLHQSRLWDFEKGAVIATTYQDGMIRIPTEDIDVIELLKGEIENKPSMLRDSRPPKVKKQNKL